jgi:hypothetical protein
MSDPKRAIRAWLNYEGSLSYEKLFIERVRLACFGALSPIDDERARDLEELAAEADDEPVEGDPPPPSPPPSKPRLVTPPATERVRVRTMQRRILSRAERVEMREAEREVAHLRGQRPKTRGDCAGGQRPCPWVGCRYHLALDVNPKNGSIKIAFPHLEIWELPETCALDVADRRGETLEEVGGATNLTRQRIEQIEAETLRRLRAGFPKLERWLDGEEEEE